MNKELLLKIKDHRVPTKNMNVKYIVKASIEDLKGKEMLFISFFNQENWKPKADFKVFICGRQYISQKLLHDGSYKWSSACLENLLGYWWDSRRTKTGTVALKDRKVISNYLKVSCIKNGEEFKVINQYQLRIMKEKLNVRYDKIKKRIDDVMDKISPLPKDFDRWIYNVPFDSNRYVYYKRKGKLILGYCAECGEDFVIEETELTKKNIKHNNNGRCPNCNKNVIYKAGGKTKRVLDRTHFSIMQKFEDGFVIRYFSGYKYGDRYSKPNVEYHEIIRTIFKFENEELVSKKYEYDDFMQTGHHRWCDDSGKVYTPYAYLYTRNIREVLKNTKWKYCCLYEYTRKNKALYTGNYLIEYLKYPAIEYFIKLKLFNFVKECLSEYYGGANWKGINFKGKNLKDVLGLDKEKLIQAQRLNVGRKGMEILRGITKQGKSLTDSELKWGIENVNRNDFLKIIKYTTPNRAIKYINTQAKDDYSYAHVLIDWCDYINQCDLLEYDIKNTFILFPKNLKARHEEFSMINKSKGLKQYEKKFERVHKKLDALYSYENKELLIRPVKSIDEIVKEGQRLRHCVGGEGYIKRISAEEIAIMLIRKKDKPKSPYFTLELDLRTLEVRQCRGYKNCSTNDEVEKLLEKWKKSILYKKLEKKAV